MKIVHLIAAAGLSLALPSIPSAAGAQPLAERVMTRTVGQPTSAVVFHAI